MQTHTHQALRYLLLPLIALHLAACCTPQAPLVKVPVAHVLVCSKQPWNDTGIQLKANTCYLITSKVAPGEPYADSYIPCTPDGPQGPLGWLQDWAGRDATGNSWKARQARKLAKDEGVTHHLRVLSDRDGVRASFLTLIATIGKSEAPENVYVIGSRRTFTARKSGRLYLFSNDWPGGDALHGDGRFYTGCPCHKPTYDNNKGVLEVTIEELRDCPHTGAH